MGTHGVNSIRGLLTIDLPSDIMRERGESAGPWIRNRESFNRPDNLNETALTELTLWERERAVFFCVQKRARVPRKTNDRTKDETVDSRSA